MSGTHDNSGVPNFSHNQPAQADFGSFDLSNLDFDNLDPNDAMNFDFGNMSDTGATVTPNDLSLNADMNQFLPGPAIPQEVQPMNYQQPAPAPMTAPGPPGACFHPAVGWYFPAQTAALPAPGFQMAIPSTEGYAAIPQPAQMLQVPQPQTVRPDDYDGNFQEKPKANVRKQGSKRKELFGPAAHFGIDAKSQRQKRAAADDADDERPRKAIRTSKNSTKKSAPTRPRGKSASIEAACVCPTGVGKATSGVKRPKNCFIIFRMMHQKAIATRLGANPANARSKNGQVRHDLISREAGAMWKALSASEKQQYVDMAQAEAEKHREIYPDYKYDPKRSAARDPNFGTPDCECGAYKRNMAKASRVTGSAQDLDDSDSEPDELDDYVPPRQKTASRAPAARMGAALPDVMPDFGFSTPQQQAEAAAQYTAMQARQRAAQTASAKPPTPLRRSSRNRTHTNITYTEPSDAIDLTDDTDNWEATVAAQLTEANTVPPAHLEGMPTNLPSLFNTPMNSPPSARTRSKTSLSPTIPEGLGLPNFDDMFDENGELTYSFDDFVEIGSVDADTADVGTVTAADDDDNIIVAGRARRSSSKSTRTSPRRLRRSPRHS